MLPEKFRRQLRQESEKWWSEGLINAELYEQLARRYQFDRLEREASNRFITILMGLGAVLLGLGVITFVAANWQVWPRPFKIFLLLGCFVGVNAAGFYLWRRPAHQKGLQRLGHALLLLGALLLGANMGLMSQMFHQSGELYGLLLIWGLGVVAMAYSLRLTSLGVLALILVGLGYWLSWFSSQTWNEFSGTSLVVQHFPLVVSLVFVPLAYWCRSRAIFGLSAIAIAMALVLNLKPWLVWNIGWLVAIAFVLPPALLWAYSDSLWQFSGRNSPRREPGQSTNAISPTHARGGAFQPIARSLAVFFLSVLFFWLAFHWWWENSTGNTYWLRNWNGYVLIDAVVLGLVAGLGWLQLGTEFRLRRFQERVVGTPMIGLFLLLTAGVLIGQWGGTNLSVIPTVVFNILLFLLALGLIRDGLALAQRSTFWGGMVLLVLSILGRVLEYDTGLLLKSIVFVVCGVGVIAAGLWFERNVQPHHVASLPQSSQEELL